MASRSLGTLTIDLLTRTGAFEQGMDRNARTAKRKFREIDEAAQASTRAVQKAWGTTATFIGGALAGISVGSVFNKFITETVSAQRSQAQLGAVIRSTGQAAGYNAQQLNSMAASLSLVGTASAVEINDAQTALLAFTGIVGAQFPRALQAAADMAARTGVTVRSAAETIGRALDVPSQGLSSLSRQGFRFTDQQKALVEQLEATGRTAEAQGVILKALEESYGGAAEASRNNLGGALQSLQGTISSLLTGSDSGVQGLRNGIEGLNAALSSDTAKNAVETLGSSIEILGVLLVARLAVPVVSASVSLSVLAAKSALASAGLAGVNVALEVTATRMAVMGRVARVASASLALVGGPIGAIVLGVAGAAYAWRDYSSSARDSASESVRSVSDIKGSIDELVGSYQKLNELQRQQVINIKTDDLAKARGELEQFDLTLQSVFSRNVSTGRNPLGNGQLVSQFREQIREIGKDVSISSDEMSKRLSEVVNKFADAAGMSERHRAKLIDVAAAAVTASGNVSALTNELTALGDAQSAAAAGVPAVVDSLDKYRQNYEKFMRQFATPQERLKSAVEEQKKLLGELYSPEVESRLRDSILPRSGGGGAQSTELQNLTKQLERQAETLGMTAQQAERYRIETAKGTQAQREQALALFDAQQVIKNANDAQEAYSRLVRDLRTPEEQATEQLRERMMVLDQARLSMEEYAATAERIANAAIESAPQYGGLDASIGGAAGELAKIEEAREQLEEWYQTQLDMQRSFLDEKSISEEAHASAVAEITRQKYEQLDKIQSAYKTTSLAMFSDLTLQTISMLDAMGKKGSAGYKALFLASKAAAIAQAVVNTEEAATKALTAGPVLGIPKSLLVRAIGYTSVAAIAAQTITGMAHDGIDSVPETGTWLLEKGERVMTSQTSAKLDGVLSQVQSGGGSGVIVNLIEDRERAGTVETTTSQDSEQILNIFVADIRGGGRAAQAIEGTYGMSRRGT